MVAATRSAVFRLALPADLAVDGSPKVQQLPHRLEGVAAGESARRGMVAVGPDQQTPGGQ